MDVTESKIITEITKVLLNNPFRLGFTAIIVGAGLIKAAIQAAVEISSAESADRISANRL